MYDWCYVHVVFRWVCVCMHVVSVYHALKDVPQVYALSPSSLGLWGHVGPSLKKCVDPALAHTLALYRTDSLISLKP